jgi:hypothetical protein
MVASCEGKQKEMQLNRPVYFADDTGRIPKKKPHASGA